MFVTLCCCCCCCIFFIVHAIDDELLRNGGQRCTDRVATGGTGGRGGGGVDGPFKGGRGDLLRGGGDSHRAGHEVLVTQLMVVDHQLLGVIQLQAQWRRSIH